MIDPTLIAVGTTSALTVVNTVMILRARRRTAKMIAVAIGAAVLIDVAAAAYSKMKERAQ